MKLKVDEQADALYLSLSDAHAVSPDGQAKLLLNCPGGPIVAQEARGIDARTVQDR
jgi:uncharacterized protein YuzE